MLVLSSADKEVQIIESRRIMATHFIEGKAGLSESEYELPSEVIDNILARLPIKDAVCTSILSRNWRFKWHTLPKLKFNDKCLPPSSNPGGSHQADKLVRIIDFVLTLHIGPIQQFKLSTCSPSFPDINRWIICLCRNHVKELILKFSDADPFNVPSHLFHCDELTYLQLHNCIFKPPASFKGFASLSTLILKDVYCPVLEDLILNCQHLNTLSLDRCDFIRHLKIRAPNLQNIYLYGDSLDLSFENSPNVAVAIIELRRERDYGDNFSLYNILCSLPKIKNLQVACYSIQYLADGHVPKMLPVTQDLLKNLYMVINFEDTEEMRAALCLLRSSPKLQVLKIHACSTSDDTDLAAPNSWEFQGLTDLAFNNLQTVKLAGLTGRRQELSFIKLLLAHAPVLKAMMISIDSETRVIEDSKIFMELMRFRRASAEAEIIYTDNLVL